MNRLNKIIPLLLLLISFLLFNSFIPTVKAEACPCHCGFAYPPDTPDSEVGKKDQTYYIQSDDGCSSDSFKKACDKQCSTFFSGSGEYTSTSKYKILDCTPKTPTLPDGTAGEPISNDCDLNDFGRTLNSVAKVILGLTGSLALLMFVYGGFTWVISSGNREMIQKGKNILVAAVIGIIIVFVAYSAIEFALRALTNQTKLDENPNVIFFQGSESPKEWNK
ncbi:MAG: pilin [bacterium]